MEYKVNFGRVAAGQAKAHSGTSFRIAVLADLSGRANRGRLETGAALADRKPLRVDVDNLDEIIERLDIQLQLPIGDGGGNVQVPLTEMDDFHPDQLFEHLEIFSKLSGLRKKLADPASFDGAARAIQTLLGTAAIEQHVQRREIARGAAVPNSKLSDFASLVGRPTVSDPQTPIVDLIKQMIRPHVIPDADPRQDQMVATVDEALSDTMRRVLHHPDFQSLESVWRCIEILVRRLETDENLQIVLYDITAEEIAADLSASDDLSTTGLYQLLVEQPALDDSQGGLSVLVGNYTFEQTPPHADLLGRIAKIAASANAPFIAAIGNEALKKTKPEEIHPVVQRSWDALRALPEAAYLGLVVPRFMLRWPFGKKTEPIDAFAFEEFTNRSGVQGMLWGNSAFLSGLLLGLTFQDQGIAAMQLGSVLGVDDLPFYYYTDADGDQVALPCTDRLLSERMAAFVSSQRFTPVLSMKGRPEVRLGGFLSLAGTPLAGRWSADHGTSVEPLESAFVAASEIGDSIEESVEAVNEPDAELDSLLADLEGIDAQPETEADGEAEAMQGDLTDATQDDDLDSLLAELEGDSVAPVGSEEIDPELEALLGDL